MGLGRENANLSSIYHLSETPIFASPPSKHQGRVADVHHPQESNRFCKEVNARIQVQKTDGFARLILSCNSSSQEQHHKDSIRYHLQHPRQASKQMNPIRQSLASPPPRSLNGPQTLCLDSPCSLACSSTSILAALAVG